MAFRMDKKKKWSILRKTGTLHYRNLFAYQKSDKTYKLSVRSNLRRRNTELLLEAS